MLTKFRSIDAEQQVKYLDPNEREMVRLTIRDGLFYTASGNLADTIVHQMYVVDPSGDIFSFVESNLKSQMGHQGRLHHSSFLAGGDVLAAGQIGFENGRLVFIDNGSGHYLPEAGSLTELLRWLSGKGVDIGQVTYEFADRNEQITPQDSRHISRALNRSESAGSVGLSECQSLFSWFRAIGVK